MTCLARFAPAAVLAAVVGGGGALLAGCGALASFDANAGGGVATFAAAPASLAASTNVGPITLTVPRSASYQVDAHTVVGGSTVTVRRGGTAHTVTKSDLGSISVSPG